MKILIAEDDMTSRSILTALLKRGGHEVLQTTNGAEAWASLQEPEAPKVAILDWMMPGMDGLEVCRRIRRLAGRYTYVVMQTAKGSEEDIEAGFLAGADDYLIKPIDREQLLQRLRVAERILAYEARLSRYADEMQVLAEERARQLLHADRMATLGTLSAGVAHEINNPASFISGNAQTMERVWTIVKDRLDKAGVSTENDPQLSLAVEEFPRMVSGIRNGVERISRIVTSLKGYARMDGGAKQRFEIRDAISAALELCHGSLKYNIEVTVTQPETAPTVWGNKGQIEQVLINLITNAADAVGPNKKGMLSITVTVKGDMMTVSVRDNGPGLNPETIDKVFDPFFTTKKEGKGTGLGLSISKGIIEEHGGELTAANGQNGGAVFAFCLRTTATASDPERQKEGT